MPVSQYLKLKGLTANDRTPEEKRAIEQQMGYETSDTLSFNTPSVTAPSFDSSSAEMLNNIALYQQHLDSQYEQALAERQQEYGADRQSSNLSVNDYLDKVANNASSYYKKFKGTDKLPLDDQEKKQLAAQYDARKGIYGEQNADIWLDNYFKDKVANNQSWLEQALHGISHLVPAIEGGLIQTYGMLHGTVAHIIGAEGYDKNDDLNWFDSFINDVIDNPVTRYGRDVERSGSSHILQGFSNLIGLHDEGVSERIASMKESATKYNPEGIGSDAIVTTQEQDDSYFSSSTPWQALQSGGFTALSMITGAAEAKVAGWLFGKAAKGINWLHKTNRLIKTEKGLERTLEGLKRVQNFTDIAVIPGTVGSVEGAIEGLNTKIEVEHDAISKLDEYYRDKVTKEAEELFNSSPMVDAGDGTFRRMTPDEAFKQVWEKYEREYAETRQHIDWASSKAGVYNFWANSMINGLMNTTLKAGLMAPRVQETLRNSRYFGWAYKNPKFTVNPEGVVTSKMSKAGLVGRVLKEPLGEGFEEYAQTITSDVTASGAENNIDEFIKNKFERNGTVQIAEFFGSDLAAALTALKGSLTNKESIQSAILGAVSSTMGTVGGMGRGYHRDDKGNLVRNSLFSKKNFTRSLDKEGNLESWTDYARRITPWRSGAINAYFDRREEMGDAQETAAALTEWLKDPQNRAKWDGLQGTANWLSQMGDAAESNDQFSYRKSQKGKAINDVFMLSKLKGTSYYDTFIADLQRAASGEVTQNDIQKLKENGGEDYQNVSDEEVVEKIKSNANKMLGLMSQVEQEGKNLDRMLGRIDEDTKQSLIFGKIMEQDFRERRDQLQDEIETIKGRIQNSRSSNTSGILENELANLLMKYGSLNQALHEQQQLESKKEKTEMRVSELQAIDPQKMSDKQKEELVKSKLELKRLDRQLETFDALCERDENGKKTAQIDSSLAQMVLNEQDIMNLDPMTRAIVLSQGAAMLYNATHQSRQRVDQLNLEIDDINRQIDILEAQMSGWLRTDGGIKKGHNKQYQRNSKKVEELQKQKEAKMRTLDAEQGKQDTKSIYNSAQQEVIDNLVQQGMAQDEDFLDKVIDVDRLEKGIKDYHQQYQVILSDPKAFQNYVQRAKYYAQRDLTRRRAEMITNIENFEDYSREIDRLTANASQQEVNDIRQVLREQDAKLQKQIQIENTYVDDEGNESLLRPKEELPKTNFQRYVDNVQKKAELIMQFAKNPNLTDNDRSLLEDAMQYLSSKGIDVTDREAAVQALIERDEQGNQGGKFREFVEAKNDQRLPQQRTFMPVFTSIGQVVGQYVDLLNGRKADHINRGNIQSTTPSDTSEQAPLITTTTTTAASPSAAQPEPSPQGTSLFNIGYADGGQFVDGDGTVATGAQTQSMKQRQQEKAESEEQKSALRQLFEKVATPEIAKMVDNVAGIIENSNESQEIKNLAMQYLEDLAVNNDITYSTLDDLMTDVQVQVNRLKNQADMQEEEDNNYSKAAGLLQKIYGSLNAKKLRGRERTAPLPSSRPVSSNATAMMSANLYKLQQVNPDAWALTFSDTHNIDGWNRDHWPSLYTDKTPIYFITDSEWTAEVTRQMTIAGRKYNTLNDMPVVAAVRVEAPQNPNTSTAIEVDGQWYQPVAIIAGAKSKVSGAANTQLIRKLASQQQGRHLITANGLPNGNPLITGVYTTNYLVEHQRDQAGDGQTVRENTKESNYAVLDLIIRDFVGDKYGLAEVDRLNALSKEELLNDDIYKEAVEKFLDKLQWHGEGSGDYSNKITFTPDNERKNETGNPMIIFDVPMAETVGRTSDKTLPEVLESGTEEEFINFNSRISRLFNEVIRPLFVHVPSRAYGDNGDLSDKSAKIITQQDEIANPDAFKDECDRLTKLLNGFNKEDDSSKGIRGVKDFIWIKDGNWSFKVTAPKDLQTKGSDKNNSESVYKVFLVNTNSEIPYIELGEIRVSSSSDKNPATMNSAVQLLKNLLWDGQQIRDFLKWQVPYADVRELKEGKAARRNIASIVDDNILTIAGSALNYDTDGMLMYSPLLFGEDGQTARVAYPQDKVVNPTNAQPAAPQNITPQGDGAVVAGDGSQVLGDSGANLGDTNNGLPTSPTPPAESEKLRKAKEITRRIIEDSNQFQLSEDETHYYIKDNVTGEETKYLRVTTVIGADESASQWTPSIDSIYNKLRERHALQELNSEQLATFKSIDQMSRDLNIPVAEIRRAVAELRTTHKKEKYGVWSVPSTAVGNTADIITRDFLAGNLKESYPNITPNALKMFVEDLRLFKSNLESLGIHIVPEGVVAHGKITMTDTEGKQHDVNVAGTLDLFGYDDNGNFYIFDMKTTRNHSQGKLEQEKAKWSRQISMYADLLKQSYGIEVKPENLRIIPIDVDYPAPMGSRNNHLDPAGPQYSVTPEGQLQMTYRGGEVKDFDGSNLSMRGHTFAEQFPPGYTPFNINWDNLSSEDQDIADTLSEQAQNDNEVSEQAPQEATIETPKPKRSSILAAESYINDYVTGTQEALPSPPPIIPNGQKPVLPSWKDLTDVQKELLKSAYEIETMEDYHELLNDPATAEGIAQDLGCRGVL